MQSFRIPYLGADGADSSWPDMPGFWGTYVRQANIAGFDGAFDVYRDKQLSKARVECKNAIVTEGNL
jgi:hypothetical protein